MVSDNLYQELERFRIRPGEQVKLSKYSTGYEGEQLSKKEAEESLEEGRKMLSDIQDKLYAHNRYSILIILQAMDAAGKDGAVKHILSGVNPLGVRIHSFKAPTNVELDHSYLWRHMLALPARGEIAIHNRSHYENVLVTRVHPEFILKENLPGIEQVDHIPSDFWLNRFDQINRFEKNISETGTIVLKFFLHLSKNEQKKRLVSRIDDPSKNWKFDLGDMRERARWDDYQQAYEEAISATSKREAPWFVIPADDKWFTRLAIAAIMHREINKLGISYPVVSEEQRKKLLAAKEELMREK